MRGVYMAKTYVRICADCGNSKEITYKPKKDTKCMSCACRGQTHKKKSKEDLVRYTYVCSECGDTRVLKAKRKTTLCGACNSRLRGEANGKIKDKPIFRFFRVCPLCPEDDNTVRVKTAKNGGVKPCKKHSRKPKKTYQKIGVDGAKRNKVTVKFQVDETTMEAPIKRRKPKALPKQQITDEEMMAKFLETNKVTIIEPSTSEIYTLREKF